MRMRRIATTNMAQTEVNMKAICAGTKTKNDVVHETLEKYREMYVRTSSRIDVLRAVSHGSLHFHSILANRSTSRPYVDMYLQHKPKMLDLIAVQASSKNFSLASKPVFPSWVIVHRSVMREDDYPTQPHCSQIRKASFAGCRISDSFEVEIADVLSQYLICSQRLILTPELSFLPVFPSVMGKRTPRPNARAAEIVLAGDDGHL